MFKVFFRTLTSNRNRFVPVELYVLHPTECVSFIVLTPFYSVSAQLAIQIARCTNYSKSVCLSVWLSHAGTESKCYNDAIFTGG